MLVLRGIDISERGEGCVVVEKENRNLRTWLLFVLSVIVFRYLEMISKEVKAGGSDR